MRVITGKARGAKLNTLEGIQTRPTAEKVKEAVFSSLFDKVNCDNVLDVFAGSGQMGIEALSRGAKFAVFVEQDRKAVAIVKGNIKTAKLEGQSAVFPTDAFSFFKSNRTKFDLVFLDPPYNKGLVVSALKAMSEAGTVADGGTVVCESDKIDEIPETVGAFKMYKQAFYGRTVISYFVMEEEA